MSLLIGSYKIDSIRDNGNGVLDDDDAVWVDDPQTNEPTLMKMSTFLEGGNAADQLLLLQQARQQGLKCDLFLKKHPLQK